MNMEFIRKLPIPQEIKKQYPLPDAAARQKADRDAQIRAIFSEEDVGRILLIIGPCSADNRDAILEYIERLVRLQEKVSDRLLLIPRVYTGKPRSAGEGYMGMLHQPDPVSGKEDILRGMIATRELHLRILCDYGMSCADEMLYPDNHRYLSDLLSYVAVGARSVENQQHRLTASGLEIPVGMKNPIGGDLNTVVNAVRSAHLPHRFLYRGWEVESRGNPLSHAILRGYVAPDGSYAGNYDEGSMERCVELLQNAQIEKPSVVVDTNHANSGKNYLEQIRIAGDVMRARKKNGVLRRAVKGLMIESYLYDGAQTVCPGKDYRHGLSITDPCLGWEKTVDLVLSLAESV